jgi:hypothetical protein
LFFCFISCSSPSGGESGDPPAFVPVTGISGVPGAAVKGTPLALTGTVEPANATNKTIAWTVINAGATEASITGNTLSAANTGAVTVRASVAGGQTASTPYTQDFTVQIKAPGTFIPAYTRHSYSTVKDITFTPMVGTYTLDNILPYTNDRTGNNLQAHIFDKWLDLLAQMQVQADNLKNGYGAVKEAYPDLTGINDIIGNENSIHGKIDNTSDIGAYLSGADAGINAILNGIFTGTDRAQFDKYLTAYRAGYYHDQKVRDTNGSKIAAQEAFETALAETGLSFDELEPAMRDAINEAMGIGGINSASHRGVVSGLNGDLINQIGDLAEAQALADDFGGLKYANTLTQGMTFSYFDLNEYNQPGDAETVPATD